MIAKIRTAIEAYGLTAADLFNSKSHKQAGKKPRGPSAARYADGKGNTWVGRGKRPDWLRSELAAGASLTDFLQGNESAAAPVTNAGLKQTKRKGTGKAASAKAPKVKYQDAAGNSWSGRGRKPKWIHEALASGTLLADLSE